MPVTLFLGTQLAHEQGKKAVCRIDREHLGPGRKGGWIVKLHKKPKEWAKKHRMAYRLQVCSQWEVAMEINDPKLAMMFKLTWM